MINNTVDTGAKLPGPGPDLEENRNRVPVGEGKGVLEFVSSLTVALPGSGLWVGRLPVCTFVPLYLCTFTILYDTGIILI